ncbi:MAG: 4-phosphoerythronate dehydrogenase PdxB [Bacteroidaceae bacterium]|nr:4-phosphoerythronate dehydrogenase PdxB [Bacteroidaceae bacterium]
MRVIVDDKIPYIRESLRQVTDEAVYLPGAAMTAADVRDADALIVRTRTRCDRTLLEGSRVKFIATATIGHDHIDAAYCREAGITWTNCPGCNAGSVAQYIRSALLLLSLERGLDLPHSTLGVVGVGHVGTRVCEVGRALGMRVLCCDPPRADRGEQGFMPLDEMAGLCDVISFHTPLVREGQHPTLHLADRDFFRSLPDRPIIIVNTARGEVVDNTALKEALEEGRIRDAVIDVWEHEPEIDRALLEQVYLGTPHIAGYSADGKANAARMALEALCRHFDIREQPFDITPPPLPTGTDPNNPLALYDPRNDSRALKEHPDKFEYLRGHYPLRREHF